MIRMFPYPLGSRALTSWFIPGPVRTGNEATTKLLRNVVEVVDAQEGTVKLRRNVNQADAMALDTRSTKTTRRGSPGA